MRPRNRMRDIADHYRMAADEERPGSLRDRFTTVAAQFSALADALDRTPASPDNPSRKR